MSQYIVNSIDHHQKGFSDFNTPYDIAVEIGPSKVYLFECKSISRGDFEGLFPKQFISGSYALSTRIVLLDENIIFEKNPKSSSDLPYKSSSALLHEIAHLKNYLCWLDINMGDNTPANTDSYDFNRKVFRFASRLSYSPQFNQSLREILGVSEKTIYRYTNSSVFEYSQDPHLNIQSSSCQCFELTDLPDTENCEILSKSSTSSLKQLLDRISEILFVCIVSLFKNLINADIRLQYIANSIRNGISRNSNPYKQEPPIGGVKVGGDHVGSYGADGFYSLSFST